MCFYLHKTRALGFVKSGLSKLFKVSLPGQERCGHSAVINACLPACLPEKILHLRKCCWLGILVNWEPQGKGGPVPVVMLMVVKWEATNRQTKQTHLGPCWVVLSERFPPPKAPQSVCRCFSAFAGKDGIPPVLNCTAQEMFSDILYYVVGHFMMNILPNLTSMGILHPGFWMHSIS